MFNPGPGQKQDLGFVAWFCNRCFANERIKFRTEMPNRTGHNRRRKYLFHQMTLWKIVFVNLWVCFCVFELYKNLKIHWFRKEKKSVIVSWTLGLLQLGWKNYFLSIFSWWIAVDGVLFFHVYRPTLFFLQHLVHVFANISKTEAIVAIVGRWIELPHHCLCIQIFVDWEHFFYYICSIMENKTKW